MSLYAISDLHLSRRVEKPMDRFGEFWLNHQEKIKKNWEESVGPEDSVLICGDISWAMTLADAMPDLEYIHNLNGRKILIKGNHDFWWGKTTYMNSLFPDMFFLRNNHASYGDYAICGTRGWLCPQEESFTAQDEKIYKREARRLILSLESAVKAGYGKIILMLHYPPMNEKKQPNLFTEIITRYPVEKVIYGHLHSAYYSWDEEGYHLTSSDFLNFCPRFLL